MTRNEIIEMAREAGCVKPSHPFNPWSVSQEALERFKALVSAAEREACAKVCDVLSVHPEYASSITKFAAHAIRNRG